METKNSVTSADGTRIAYERLGSGAESLIIVAGALPGGDAFRPLAERLAPDLTVFIYDRRGRGDSGDTPPYAVEREVEDLDALIAVAPGTVSVYGHSSGAALILHAAARGLPMDRIVLHEPPFGSGGDEERQAAKEEAEKIAEMLEQGRPGDAIKFFLTPVGLPPEMIEQLSRDPAMRRNAATLPYDPYVVLSEHSRGGRTPAEQAADVTTPALVLAGGASPEWMIDAGRRIAEAMPEGRLQVLADQEHIVPPEILARC